MTELPLPIVMLNKTDYETMAGKAALWDAHAKDLKAYAAAYVDETLQRWAKNPSVDEFLKKIGPALQANAEFVVYPR